MRGHEALFGYSIALFNVGLAQLLWGPFAWWVLLTVGLVFAVHTVFWAAAG